jgi:hypothetical protein
VAHVLAELAVVVVVVVTAPLEVRLPATCLPYPLHKAIAAEVMAVAAVALVALVLVAVAVAAVLAYLHQLPELASPGPVEGAALRPTGQALRAAQAKPAEVTAAAAPTSQPDSQILVAAVAPVAVRVLRPDSPVVLVL